MTKSEFPFDVVLHADGYHVFEQGIDYCVAYPSVDAAVREVKYILWLEQVYSPPRK